MTTVTPIGGGVTTTTSGGVVTPIVTGGNGGGLTTTTAGGNNGGGATTTTAGPGSGGATTTTAGPGSGGATTTRHHNDGECVFSEWGAWSTCNAMCLQAATRTLLEGTMANCQEPDGSSIELTQVCEGGLCVSPGGGTGGGPTTATPETGCRFNDIDPQTRPSTVGFKAVGAQASCASKCAAETSFKCEAYSTTGPGGPCVLHGAVDSPTNVVIMSSWYLQDLNCKVNSK